MLGPFLTATFALVRNMGNAIGAAPGAVGVHLDTPAIYAGGIISGRIYLQIESATEATSLEVCIYGQEYSRA